MGRCAFWFCFLFFLTVSLSAQNEWTDTVSTNGVCLKKKGFKGFLQSISRVDTNYIGNNKYHASAMLLAEKRYSYYSLHAYNDEGYEQELSFAPNSPLRVGPYIGFSLLFLGYTFDVEAKHNSLNRSNIYLSLYSRFFGIDYYYESDEHNYHLKSVKGFGNDIDSKVNDISFSGMSTHFINLHVYYLFNNKHFSYPAAYSQSTVQKISCGSFILGVNYTHEKVNFDYTKLPSYLLYDSNGESILYDRLKVSNVYYRDYSLSIGYGYNWVFHKNCLANLTVSPALGYNFSKGEKFNAKDKLFDLGALNFDIISRASIVWNNYNYFVGVSAVAHTYTYKKPMFSVHNSLITLSLYSGLYFLKKKKFKTHE